MLVRSTQVRRTYRTPDAASADTSLAEKEGKETVDGVKICPNGWSFAVPMAQDN